MLQQVIDSAHFAELIAEERIRPRGDDMADLRAGIIAAAAANFSGNVKRPLDALDFCPVLKRETRSERMDAQDTQKFFERLARRTKGGKVIDGDHR